MRKAPPSYLAARPGKRRKLPRPTALPVTARMTPMVEPQLSFFFKLIGMNGLPRENRRSQPYFETSEKRGRSSCGTLGAWTDRDIGARDDFCNRLLKFIDPLLHFTHEKRGIELEKDFDIDPGSGPTSANFVQTIIVVEMLHELAENTELGGLFDGGVEQVFDGGRGHGPSGAKHKNNADE